MGRESAFSIELLVSKAQVVEMLGAVRECGPEFEVGWEAGILFAHLRKP